MTNTINRFSGSGDRSAAEEVPTTEAQRRESREAPVARRGRSATGATRETSQTSQQSVRPGGPSGPTETANVQSDGGDEVRITGAATLLADLGQRLSQVPAIDSARVARISAALAAGTYTISANSIASGLLQSEQTLAQTDM